MKKPGAEIALLTPDAQGWRIRLAGGATQSVRTLEEAAAGVPANQQIHLALPASFVVLERLTLPSTDRDELSGMVQLQLEKTLPYPVEEASSDFDVIRQGEAESTLVSIATRSAQLDELCAPLRSRARLPQKITLYAMHVAASCPPDQVVLSIWAEDGQIEAAICENGKLGFAQSFPSMDAELVLAELPQMLLSAEMEGVPTDFSAIRVEAACSELIAPLAEFFGRPVETISFDAPLPEPAGNLAPPAWQSELRRLESSARLRQQLQIVAVVYLVLLAVAFVYLAWLKSRVQKLDVQIAEAQPQIESVQQKQLRWNTLAPAIDPSRSTIEVLFLVFSSLPSSDVKITVFEHTPAQFRVEGEAPSANQAIEFVEKLRAEKGLSAFRIESPPPSILPSGSAHFNIFGKL